MVIFHSYVSLPEDILSSIFSQQIPEVVASTMLFSHHPVENIRDDGRLGWG
jgi:hypothetical protein